MSAAGLIGGLVGFLLAEQTVDTAASESELRVQAGVSFLLIMVCIGGSMVAAHYVAERKTPTVEAILIGAVALPALGFLSGYIAQALYSSMLSGLDDCQTYDCYVSKVRVPRTIGWALAGGLGGIGIGIALRSAKRLQNAVLGGLIGGAIGGVLFDVISGDSDGDASTSRLVATALIGLLIGLFYGAITTARGNLYLEVLSGELRGRQFLALDNPTRIGSARSNHITLVADRSIADTHVSITTSPGVVQFSCNSQSPVMLNGHSSTSGTIAAGDVMQIGATSVRFGFRKDGAGAAVSPPPAPSGAELRRPASFGERTPASTSGWPAAEQQRRPQSTSPLPPSPRPRIPTKRPD